MNVSPEGEISIITEKENFENTKNWKIEPISYEYEPGVDFNLNSVGYFQNSWTFMNKLYIFSLESAENLANSVFV